MLVACNYYALCWLCYKQSIKAGFITKYGQKSEGGIDMLKQVQAPPVLVKILLLDYTKTFETFNCMLPTLRWTDGTKTWVGRWIDEYIDGQNEQIYVQIDRMHDWVDKWVGG